MSRLTLIMSLLVCICIVILASFISSTRPDGLEFVAKNLDFALKTESPALDFRSFKELFLNLFGMFVVFAGVIGIAKLIKK